MRWFLGFYNNTVWIKNFIDATLYKLKLGSVADWLHATVAYKDPNAISAQLAADLQNYVWAEIFSNAE